MFRKVVPRAICCIVFVCGLVATAAACNIPVFRYALERWKPDPCEVIVFHKGALTPAQVELIEESRARTSDGSAREGSASEGSGHANARIFTVDLSANADPQRTLLWDQLPQSSEASLPHVLIRTKLGKGQFVNPWHGELSQLGDLGLFDSPARSQLRDRLLAGHSVVWLMVKSSDEKRNADARRLIKGSFDSLAAKIKLPEGIGLPGSELYADVPLVLRFSLVEMSGDDPREKWLSGLLTGFRSAAFSEGQPLLVPVFGRGRALEVIPAEDLNAKLVEDLTIFLSGACSCQVKEQNPGFDLLIDADWDGELFGDEENQPPDRSAEEGRNRTPTLVPIPAGRK